MPILHLPGEMMPGQLGPINRDRRFCKYSHARHHIQRRNALGDADDQLHLRIGSFHNCISGKWWRNKNHRRICSSFIDRFLHGVKDGPSLVSGATLAGSHSPNDLGSVLRAGFGMESAFPPGQSLHDNSRRFIYKNAHKIVLFVER